MVSKCLARARPAAFCAMCCKPRAKRPGSCPNNTCGTVFHDATAAKGWVYLSGISLSPGQFAALGCRCRAGNSGHTPHLHVSRGGIPLNPATRCLVMLPSSPAAALINACPLNQQECRSFHQPPIHAQSGGGTEAAGFSTASLLPLELHRRPFIFLKRCNSHGQRPSRDRVL